MKILAVDLGKKKSVACDYRSQTGTHAFETIPAAPESLDGLLAGRLPAGKQGWTQTQRRQLQRWAGDSVHLAQLWETLKPDQWRRGPLAEALEPLP